MISNLRFILVCVLLSGALGACGGGAEPPTAEVSAIQTQAVALVSTQAALQRTQTALAAPPTRLPSFTPPPASTLGGFPTFGGVTGTVLAAFTPLTAATPFATFSTAFGCNDGAYVGETAPLDKAVVPGGQQFEKGFTLLNTGTCTWGTGYAFAYLPDVSSPQMPGKDIVLRDEPNDHTAPGHDQSYIVKLTAPEADGEYKAYYKMRDPNGNYFGPRVYVWIVVQ